MQREHREEGKYTKAHGRKEGSDQRHTGVENGSYYYEEDRLTEERLWRDYERDSGQAGLSLRL